MNALAKEVPSEFRELLLGCGNQRKKHVYMTEDREFKELTTLDLNKSCNPDIVWDLNVTPWPFPDNSFDEVHAYEVLEHLGKQGDYTAFFAHFSEIWRILKPDGHLYGSVPMWDSPWAWSDPGHTRVISKHSFIFLSQREYEQVGKTAITDYRDIYKADLETIALDEKEHQLAFVLKAIK